MDAAEQPVAGDCEFDYQNALPVPILPVKKYWDREEGYYYLDAMNRSVSPEQIVDSLNDVPAERFPDLTRQMIDAGARVVGGDADDLHARVVAVNVWYAMERERVRRG